MPEASFVTSADTAPKGLAVTTYESPFEVKLSGENVWPRSGKSAAGPVSWLGDGLGLGVASSWPTTVFVPHTDVVEKTAVTLQPVAASRPPETTPALVPHTKVAATERGCPVVGHTSAPAGPKPMPE